MFVVDDILISDEVLTARFACNLAACHGGCCVEGDSGAPLEPDERAHLEAVLPRVRKHLTPEALAVIEEDGVWEETAPGTYATTCVDGGACVFVTYDGPIAKCGIQKAYREGRVSFEKPISCHLYPIRISQYGGYEVLNYEQIPLCDPARDYGCKHHVRLEHFLREPLVRKYGADWYQRFVDTCAERRALIFGEAA